MASPHPPDTTTRSSPDAPWLSIPSRAISMVEHPCIVKHVDKAITSLGGPVKLSQSLRSKLEPSRNTEGDDELPKLISASLRPDDPLAKRILSTPVTTSDLLLKVTVPKRTGRKRKRGSLGPFVADDDYDHGVSNQNTHVPASSIFRRLQDNVGRYTVSVAGLVDETHRFRTLPDLQFAASTSKTMVDIRDNLLPVNYGKLKNYKLNTASGADMTQHVAASALFVQMPVAYDYKYRQNAHVQNIYTDGETGIQRALAYSNYLFIAPSAESVPKGPSPNLPPEAQLSPYMQSLIASIRLELQKRPIITRHLLYNTIGWDKRDRLRQACMYCGYFFITGPWREALITWGVDPRTNPTFRKYQTVSFISYKRSAPAKHRAVFLKQNIQTLARKDPASLRNQHVFDGTNVSWTGNLFQFCDITDPFIRKILDTTEVRETCAPTMQGWYHVGTWAKATVILKHKMNLLISGEQPDNSIYERIASWPELWDHAELSERYRSEFWDKQVNKEKVKEHTVMKHAMWAARNPFYAFEKMEKTNASPSEQAEGESPVDDEVEVPMDMTEEPDTAKNILDENDDDDDDDDDEDAGDDDNDDDDEDDEDDDEDEIEDVEDAHDGEEAEDVTMIEGEDIDAEGETDDEQFVYQPPAAVDGNKEPEPPVRAATSGPLPFGGLYKS